MRQFPSLIWILAAGVIFGVGCTNASDSTGGEDAAPETITPVTVTHPQIQPMSQVVEVNAVSAFLLKTYPKANTNGYLQSVSVHLGDYVTKGQTLFVIRTKEAEALGNTINGLDSTLRFEGTLRVKAPGSGYITQLSSTAGNYVQDGETLAEVTDSRSLVFLLNLPYELKKYLPLNRSLQIFLPDSTIINGQVQSALPVMDSVAQTQQYVIRIPSGENIPENLIGKVRLTRELRPHAVVLPRAAVLSDETQGAFWIMKLDNDSTAVKIPVVKGVEDGTSVEILSPPLDTSASVLVSGNYGLPDTALVRVVKGN